MYIYNTKSGKSRKVDINEWLVETLIKLRKHPESPYVFVIRTESPTVISKNPLRMPREGQTSRIFDSMI
jgi:hypothetical protein